MVTRTKKIFVGGLSAPTTLEDVKNYFEQFGPVSQELPPNSNRTSYCHVQGYAFAEYPIVHPPLYSQIVTPSPGRAFGQEHDPNASSISCTEVDPSSLTPPATATATAPATSDSLYFQPPLVYYVPCFLVPMFANGLNLDDKQDDDYLDLTESDDLSADEAV